MRERAPRIGVRRDPDRLGSASSLALRGRYRRLSGRTERAIAGHIYAVAAPVSVKHRRPVPPRMRRLNLGIVQSAKPHGRHAIYNGGGLPVETARAGTRYRRDNGHGIKSFAT